MSFHTINKKNNIITFVDLIIEHWNKYMINKLEAKYMIRTILQQWKWIVMFISLYLHKKNIYIYIFYDQVHWYIIILHKHKYDFENTKLWIVSIVHNFLHPSSHSTSMMITCYALFILFSEKNVKEII